MKIKFLPYKLNFKGNAGFREGALFRFEFEDGGVGYGDLLPWPEYGDKTLAEELVDVKSGRYSVIFLRTIELAKEVRNLEPSTSVANHFIISDVSRIHFGDIKNLISTDNSVFKIKVGRDLEKEISWLNEMALLNLNFRLDFNAKVNLGDFKNFFSKLSAEVKKKIEFVEDPVPYNFHDWQEASKITKLAIDFEYENWKMSKALDVPFKIIILKPARQNLEKIIEKTSSLGLKYVVTSSMDPILGELQVQSLLDGIKEKLGERLLMCGCQTRHLFEDHPLFACKNFEELPWKSI